MWAVKHFRPYLYGHGCDVYTNHEALKSLLNTPQPSGRLTHWGIALQELDLCIHYRPGKKISNADALSRFPLGPNLVDPSSTPSPDVAIAAMRSARPSAKGGDTNPAEPVDTKRGDSQSLEDRKRADPDLAPIMDYIQRGVLPDGETAHELALTQNQYELLEGILYHVEPDKTLRVILPRGDRKKVFDEAHAGPYGGHLRDAKMYGQLPIHYWWPKMCADVISWCRACLTCASR